MEEKNAVVQMAQPFESQLITYPTTEEAIQEVEEKFKDIPDDLSVKENYTFVKKGISVVGKMVTATETRRKELKKNALEYGRKVDSMGNSIKDRLNAVRQPMKEVKVKFDTAEEIKRREVERQEKERQEAIEIRINEIRNMVADNIQSNSVTLKELIDDLQKNTFRWAAEHAEKVKELSAATVENLTGLLNMKIQSEAAEKAEAEREAKEKEAQKKQQVENARIAAENKKQAESLRTAQEKIRKDQEAIEIEKRKIAAKKEQAAEAERAAAQAKKDAEEEERQRVLRIKSEKEAKLRADAQATVEAEREAKEKEAQKKQQEEQEIEERRIAGERALAAAKNLQADIISTCDDLVAFEGLNHSDGKQLISNIRNDKYKHLKWV